MVGLNEIAQKGLEISHLISGFHSGDVIEQSCRGAADEGGNVADVDYRLVNPLIPYERTLVGGEHEKTLQRLVGLMSPARELHQCAGRVVFTRRHFIVRIESY